MNKKPKVVRLYDDRVRHHIGIFRHIMYSFWGKEKVVYHVCVLEHANQQDVKYAREYGNIIPSSIGSALFRHFKDKVEDIEP